MGIKTSVSSNEFCNSRLPQNDSEKINILEVIDATGRVVFAKSDSFTDHNMIDLNSFGSGLYYFRIITTYGALKK